MLNENLDSIVAGIAKNYHAQEIYFTDPDKHFPNKKAIIDIVKDIRRVMFPRYFGDETPTGTKPEYFIGETLIRIEAPFAVNLRKLCSSRAATNTTNTTKLKSSDASTRSAHTSSASFRKFSAFC